MYDACIDRACSSLRFTASWYSEVSYTKSAAGQFRAWSNACLLLARCSPEARENFIESSLEFNESRACLTCGGVDGYCVVLAVRPARYSKRSAHCLGGHLPRELTESLHAARRRAHIATLCLQVSNVRTDFSAKRVQAASTHIRSQQVVVEQRR